MPVTAGQSGRRPGQRPLRGDPAVGVLDPGLGDGVAAGTGEGAKAP
ncbi:hypothetical protein [Streptomyces niveus]|nr:hypothetical protein M877_32405 [Streptomyces niveus NCIMB 11891]